MRVFLTGFMGSGKTTVGRALAAALGWAFVDLDAEVESRAAMTVRDIFERRGEPAFRDLEHQVLDEVLAREGPAVVATGGGTFTFPRNLALIRGAGVSVWLNPSFATIGRRIGALGKQDRPLFRNEVEALALYRARLDAYREADHRVDVGADERPEEVAVRVALWLQQVAAGRRLEGSDPGDAGR
ncbi:MAG TPA: shikimate kinase [Thermoanaerobaculia bacterium]|nr:shikimate kinase [Thermoanaerobaculia bacterium]